MFIQKNQSEIVLECILIVCCDSWSAELKTMDNGKALPLFKQFSIALISAFALAFRKISLF
jgi:hypothetical protein